MSTCFDKTGLTPDEAVDEIIRLRSLILVMQEALKGTLYLFEAHAVSRTDLEQIAFARSILKRAKGKV